MGTCTRLDFLRLEKNPDTYGNRPISTFMIFLMKNEFWGPDGHLHAPRFFVTGTKSRHPWEQANLNLNCFFRKQLIMGNRRALASLIGFCSLATKRGNPTRKRDDSYGNRPISEHTLVQPRTSSSDIEWWTPFPPPHSNIHI